MIDVQSILKRSYIEVTLSNEAGEFKKLGEPSTLRPTKDHYTLIFKTDGQYSNIHPFTTALIHTGRKLHEIVSIAPTFMEGAKTVELFYA